MGGMASIWLLDLSKPKDIMSLLHFAHPKCWVKHVFSYRGHFGTDSKSLGLVDTRTHTHIDNISKLAAATVNAMLTYSAIFPTSCRCRWNYAIASSARIFPQYFRTRTQMSWIYGHSREWCATNALLFCRPSRLRLSRHTAVFFVSPYIGYLCERPGLWCTFHGNMINAQLYFQNIAFSYFMSQVNTCGFVYVCLERGLFAQTNSTYRAIYEFICGLCCPHCAVMFYRVYVSNLLVYCLYHFIAKHTYLSEFSY